MVLEHFRTRRTVFLYGLDMVRPSIAGGARPASNSLAAEGGFLFARKAAMKTLPRSSARYSGW
jgi:hypothetical protein